MNNVELEFRVGSNFGTKSEFFEQNGYLKVPNMILDPENLREDVPRDLDGKRWTGSAEYVGSHCEVKPVEKQVPGSFARYNHKKFKQLHYLVRKQVEEVLGIDLLPTYYYDRFYFAGQDLKRHFDRPACEVSVTLQISSNGKEPWPIWFQRPDGSEAYLKMNDGDAVIYKGCDRHHWREPLKSRYGKWKQRWLRFRKKEDDTYHHQIFLHYVRSQGPFVHHAYDRTQN